MNLDISTLSLVVGISSLLQATIVASLYLLANQYQGIGHSAVGRALVALGFLVLVFQPWLPSFAIVVANTAMVAGVTANYLGVAKFANRPTRARWLAAPTVGGFLSFLYFTYVQDDIHARTIIVSIITGAFMLVTSRLILKHREVSYRGAARLSIVVLMIYGSFLLFRAVVIFATRPLETAMTQTPIQTLSFLVIFVASYLWTTGFVLMVIQRLYHDLAQAARLDFLTRLPNRGTMQQTLEREVARCLRGAPPCAVMLLDVDRFKQINDTQGHDAGDQVLQSLAATLARGVRAQDSVGRWGGEEFLILLPTTPLAEAAQVAERLRVAVEATPTVVNGVPIAHAVSIGLAAFGPDGASASRLVTAADQALYEAKCLGRNRVVSAAALAQSDGRAARLLAS